jgi:hypothetical protein
MIRGAKQHLFLRGGLWVDIDIEIETCPVLRFVLCDL